MTLGRLTKIDPRDIWKTEDRDFTPWLAGEENIALLGETLGLELEVEAEEKAVGPFRADILCKDLSEDSWVLIENQLERTDHKHLGQLMTYAAGLKAVTIVWIATKFTDEHRQAMDWLNGITDDDFRFFGLEVELWKIGDSAAAPKFNIVSQPNEWTRAVGAATKRLENKPLSETKALQLAYWEGFQAYALANRRLSMRKPLPRQWSTQSIGRSGIDLGATVTRRTRSIAVELYIGNQEADVFFEMLKVDQAAIERDLGFGVAWMPLPTRRACRVSVSLDDAELNNKARWPEYFAWMADKLEAFDRVFRPRVKALDPDEWWESEQAAMQDDFEQESSSD